jgi:hypothetical protein
MTTIAEKIIKIKKNHEPIGGQTEGVVFKLKDGWLLKVGHSLAEKIIYDNQVLNGLSLELNRTITQAVNGWIYSLNTSDPIYDISIIRYVPNQNSSDFEKGEKNIEDFPLSAYVLLIGQMMDAIANGLYPDLIGANILVNYKEQRFQLIDSFQDHAMACRAYNDCGLDFFTALYQELNILHNSEEMNKRISLGKLSISDMLDNSEEMNKEIFRKLQEAIQYMGFMQSDGPYENYDEAKLSMGESLQFPPFNTKGLGLITKIPLSADSGILIRQLDIIEDHFPPHPICNLSDRPAQNNR